MNRAVGALGSNVGSSFSHTFSTQYEGVPSGPIPDVPVERGFKNDICIGIPAHLDAIDPNYEGITESRPRLCRRADEIGDRVCAGLHDAIAQPAHTACLFYSVRVTKAQVFVDIRAYSIGVEMNGIE